MTTFDDAVLYARQIMETLGAKKGYPDVSLPKLVNLASEFLKMVEAMPQDDIPKEVERHETWTNPDDEEEHP